ncbi:hypothetical protein [Streptomyces sp. cg35]|uniref:hypothetical protein n=1 Tax=Streptomyces sp. cg35 TaxID=3421650 RepID=UPI003D162A28
MSPFISSGDLGATEIGKQARRSTLVVDLLADQFGDDLTRALYRETTYNVPDDQRSTCPVHQDWTRSCLDLHVGRAA